MITETTISIETVHGLSFPLIVQESSTTKTPGVVDSATNEVLPTTRNGTRQNSQRTTNP
ncbi:hypothetical protein Pla52nx_003195 [Stieleria varia]|uniref:Uncharacterized protein n=1 Tax=Stieleria varia TaxID=2528005 RepID=A0A5C6A1X1_9BACT|nr:hypothetical protein Pla52n_56800 [Stieleria varia]